MCIRDRVNIADDFEYVLNNQEIYQVLVGCCKKDYSELMKNVSHAKITASYTHPSF